MSEQREFNSIDAVRARYYPRSSSLVILRNEDVLALPQRLATGESHRQSRSRSRTSPRKTVTRSRGSK